MESFFGHAAAKMTLKPHSRPHHKEASRRQALHQYTKRTLGTGFIRQAVALPPREDLEEWLACNTVDFYNAITLLVGIVTDDSQPRLDPGWGFPPGFEYVWIDAKTRKPIKCSGPDYIEHVLSWVEGVVNDERTFLSSPPYSPATFSSSSSGGSSAAAAAAADGRGASRYPRDFKEKTVKVIFKRLFRIFAILYTHHYQRMEGMGAVAHLNTTFKHFIFFAFEFDLIPPPELEAIDTLVDRMRMEFEEQGGHLAPATLAALPSLPSTPVSVVRP